MKIIKIQNCVVCPYARMIPKPYCGLRKLIAGANDIEYSMEDLSKIPDWCPADDYKEER